MTMHRVPWQEDDFSWIRGANFVPSYARTDVEIWDKFDPEVIDRELGYAARLGINSVRVFFQIIVYEKDPALYLERFETFLSLCDQHGITMMPVLFDSCFGMEPEFEYKGGWVANPGNTRVSQDTWPGCESYIDEVVGQHINDPRIALWDIMNEPMMAGEFSKEEANRNQIWKFVNHFLKYVNELDPNHATTVGIAFANSLEHVEENSRVLSFHSYNGEEAGQRKNLHIAKDRGKALGKAVVISETGHYATGQGYEMPLRVCREENMGWYIWELMIAQSPFPKVQGIFYPDGTVRSAVDACAVMGIKVKPLLDGVVPSSGIDPDTYAARIDEALATPTNVHNLEGRCILLYAAEHSLPMVLLRKRINNPTITMSELWVKLEDPEDEDVQVFFKLQAEAAQGVQALIEPVEKLRKNGASPELFAAIDSGLKALRDKLN